MDLLLYALEVADRELESSAEHMVALTPDVGSEYIGFWK